MLNGRPGPRAVVLLSARSTEGEWLTEILGGQTSSVQAHVIEEIELPDVHPRVRNVYRHTHDKLRLDATDTLALPAPPPRQLRTTVTWYFSDGSQRTGTIRTYRVNPAPPDMPTLADLQLYHTCSRGNIVGGGSMGSPMRLSVSPTRIRA